MLGDMDPLTEDEVARRAGVTPETLRSWVGDGLLPRFGGTWTPEVAAQARLVARLQARGHSPSQIRDAEERGALAFGGIEHLLGAPGPEISLDAAAEEVGLDPGFAAEALTAVGFAVGRRARAAARARRRHPARRHRARRRGRAPARRAAAAAAGLRPRARAGRRRRGAALPPLRPRAAHAGRRVRRAHRGGDGGPRPRRAAARRADHAPRAPPAPAALRRPGRHRSHGGGRRRRQPAHSRGGCASRSPSPISPATRG